MIRDYVLLAFENLKHRGLRSWLTLLGIFIGIAAVVSLISLGQGLKETVTGQFGALDADKLTIQNAGTGFGPPGSTVIEKLTSNDVEIIEGVRGVDFVIPRLIRIVSVELNGIREFHYVGSVTEEPEEIEVIKDAINAEVERGRFLEVGDRKKIVLGHDFTNEERFDREIEIGTKLAIEGEEFEVVGILESTASLITNGVIAMMEEDMKDLLEIGDEVDLIVAQVEDPDEIEDVAEGIKEALREDRNLDEGKEDFSVETPLQSLSGINTVLNIINLVVVGIAMLSLFVGGIGIANTMYTSVVERTNEIGIMKAVGARNGDVLMLFLMEAGFLGLVGGIVGAIVGLALAFGAAAAAKAALGGFEIAVQLSMPLLLLAIGFSFLVGVLAGLVPAFQASRLNPVEALRK